MAKVKTKIRGLDIIISKKNIKIKDAYKIRNKNKMKEILTEILEKDSDYTTERTMEDLIKEWVAHNRLYYWHILRKHTSDCDFENNIPSWYKKIAYSILGGIV